MAQRYGGEHSPQGRRDPEAPRAAVTPPRPPELSFRGRSPARHAAKINLLFAVAGLSVIPAFFQSITGLATDLVGAAFLFLAAWLTRDGVRAEDAYNERKVARRPAIPRKIFGSVATGLGVAGLVFGGNWQVLPAALAGIVAAALHFVSFGPDPMRDKGLEGIDMAETDRVARKIEAAESLLAEMKDAILRARDRELETRVDSFAHSARAMFRAVEEDPRDLSRARRYIGVYLQGARDATVKFADIYARNRDTAAREDYVSLLTDLEKGFAERTKTMLLEDRSDLDVEVEVLRERLQRDIAFIEERG
ncbi:hypothetical protein HKCCE2091_15230 [Rhodobacterales bacterium HKCCE2091]|nr:hypothetical protein [Rhodobacterales bacterium HKCCE2091]